MSATTDERRLAAIRDVAKIDETMSAGAVRFLLKQLDQRDAKLASIEASARELQGQWQPKRMKPETFDQGVGAYAQDVLELLAEAPSMSAA